MKQITRIRKQLTASELVNGSACILRNGEEVGHLQRVRSAFGICYEIELSGQIVSASRDIPNALDNAAVHIWRAEAAFQDAEAAAVADDRAEMRASLYQF